MPQSEHPVALAAQLAAALAEQRSLAHRLLRHYAQLEKAILLRSELWDRYLEIDENPDRRNVLPRTIWSTQEAALAPPWIYLAVRPAVARWIHLRINLEDLDVTAVDAEEYLKVKEKLRGAGDWTLEVTFAPFERRFPKLQESRSIGRGVEFLNRSLSSQLFTDGQVGLAGLLRFLQLHHHRDQQLLLAKRIDSVVDLRQALRDAEAHLADLPGDTPWGDVADDLESFGLLPGWGCDVERVRTTLGLATDVLEAPSPESLERLLASIPMIFSVAILSPHGFFGQYGVLGLPDTGGQVVYILDQVRALEHEMRRRLALQGLDIEPQILVVTRLIPEARGTTCNERFEPISGTRSARILRVPFRNQHGEIVPQWISRFEVWPFLEDFSHDVERELLAELSGRPDLVLGNYSDGNFVATLLCRRLGVTQCTIAHALEKTKYLLSDLYWQEHDATYHFACQFTADLIAMNAADFIITSTYQEIAGNAEVVGQYESYNCFTLPGLYRVTHGIDVFDPKFNIVSPGADADVYFPHSEEERRHHDLAPQIEQLILGPADGVNSRGELAAPEKPLVFSMARLDRIKNLTGLVSWYAESEALQERANLLIIGGSVERSASQDREELAQIERLHALMDHYQLDGKLRWLGVRLPKNLAGELYRWVADRGGVFVQPALFEAFGLTVVEAMISGLPTFATRYGGPLEIIEDGVSGFHIDPVHGDRVAERLADFFARAAADPEVWQRISRQGIQRVRARYTWERYAERLMTLSRVYGFWRFVTNLERDQTRSYLEMFYGLMYRPLAQKLPRTAGEREPANPPPAEAALAGR